MKWEGRLPLESPKGEDGPGAPGPGEGQEELQKHKWVLFREAQSQEKRLKTRSLDYFEASATYSYNKH